MPPKTPSETLIEFLANPRPVPGFELCRCKAEAAGSIVVSSFLAKAGTCLPDAYDGIESGFGYVDAIKTHYPKAGFLAIKLVKIKFPN